MRSVRNYALGIGITTGIVVYVCIRLLQQMVPSGLAIELPAAFGVGLFIGLCYYVLCRLMLRRLVREVRGEVAAVAGAAPPTLHANELLELRHMCDFAVTALARHDRYAAIAEQLRRAAHDVRRVVRRTHPDPANPPTESMPALTSPLAVGAPSSGHWIVVGSLLEDLRRIHEALAEV